MVTRTVARFSNKRSGFTLVELLLATVLLLLLLGAVVFNFSNLQRGAELNEGATQLEALIRYARAHAASSGHRVKIVFEEDVGDGLSVPLGNLEVFWEPEPLNEPGIYTGLPEAAGFVRSITDLVSVELVRAVEEDSGLTGMGLLPVDGFGDTKADDESVWISFPALIFYPDGSNDSTEITLASRNAEDGRRLVVKVMGMTGTIQRKIQAADEPLIGTDFPEAASGTSASN